MRTTCCSLLVLLLCSAAPADTPVIDAGNYTLRGGLDLDQEIQIYVSGGDLIEAADFFLQIGDGTSGATIEDVDIVTGTIFDGNVVGDTPAYMEILPGERAVGVLVTGKTYPDTSITVPIPAGSSFVPGESALLATVVVNTKDFSTGTWDLDLAFDVAGAALETQFALVPTTLVNGTLTIGSPAVQLGDFDFNNVVNGGDTDDLVQALRHPSDYETKRAVDLSTVGLTIGNFNGDGAFDDDDARVFADTPPAPGIFGLPNRSSRFTELDRADLDPTIGSGNGNFFGTVFGGSLPTTYELGDSRADFNGDGVLDALDIDYISQNGPVEDVDRDVLITDILETFLGDINLDGSVNITDLAIMGNPANWGTTGTGSWSIGDLNGDGSVNITDLAILGNPANWGQSVSQGLIAPAPVPEPGTVVLLLMGLAGLIAVRLRRRTR